MNGKKKIYVDAGVLIAAFRGEPEIHRRAMRIIDNKSICLMGSCFLWLEIFPKPLRFKRDEEVEFMSEVWSRIEEVPMSAKIINGAKNLAKKYGLGAIDALHVGAALVGNADELITSEKPTKPICQVKEIKVRSIYPSAEKG